MTKSVSYIKTSPFLVIKPFKNKGFIVEDFYRKKSFEFDFKYIEIFSFGCTTRSRVEFEAFLKSSNLEKVVLQQLLEAKLLVKTSDKIFTIEEQAEKWRKYGHEDSLYYHVSCLNYPFINYADSSAIQIDQGLMDIYLKKKLPPPTYKDYTDTDNVKLEIPKILPSVEFDNILYPTENFKSTFSLYENLNILLYTSFAKIFTKQNAQGEFFLRTAPSGGGKHPTEVYLFLFESCMQIKAGIYHYDIKNHSLNLITEGNYQNIYDTASYGVYKDQVKTKNIKFGLVYTSMVERAFWRYRDIRSTRAIFADVGHIVQIARHSCVALGYFSLSEYNFDNTLLKKILELESNEPIMYSQAFYI